MTHVLDETGELSPKLSQLEISSPEVEWGRTWGFLKQKGLGGELTSFLFKFLHNLFPTNGRLSRMNLTPSPACDLCTLGVFQDLPHSLLECSYNGVFNDWILAVLLNLDQGLIYSDLSSANIATFNLEIDPEMKLAVTWFLVTAFKHVWQIRQKRKQIRLHTIKSLIEAETNLLRKT